MSYEYIAPSYSGGRGPKVEAIRPRYDWGEMVAEGAREGTVVTETCQTLSINSTAVTKSL